MRIAIIEGYTINPGDLSWEPLAAFGKLTIYDRTSVDQIVDRCRQADIVLSNKLPFTKETLNSLPDLRLINVLATGYNIIDIKAAAEKGITVCNVPAYGTASVAQHTFALLLELTNQAGLHSSSVANGEWQKSPDWCYAKTPLIELRDKTLGIIGFGNIGRQTASIAKAFGMKVIYNGPTKKETDLAEYCELERLFRISDVISLHCPLTAENTGFINKEIFQLVKPAAFLINTARGQLVNEQDLANALNNNMLAGAALDVLSAEPPKSNNPLLTAKNCIITPHNAWMSREARKRIIQITQKNIEAFLKNRPINKVNEPVKKIVSQTKS